MIIATVLFITFLLPCLTCPVLSSSGTMTAESIAFPSYPPGQGPLYGAELEAWYEDLQDILCSDTFKCSPLPECTQVSENISE